MTTNFKTTLTLLVFLVFIMAALSASISNQTGGKIPTSTLFSAGFATDPVLETKLKKLLSGFRGDVGVYVRHLGRFQETGINQFETFPTASIVKIPIIAGIHQKISTGQLNLDQEFIYHENQAYPGSGLMQFFKDKTPVDLKTLVYLMISFSDNVASIWNQELAGGGLEINKLMETLNLNVTRVNSRTPGREKDWEKCFDGLLGCGFWGWGQTSPYEMANLVALIRDGKVISNQLSQQMYRFLGNHFYDGRALSQIPPFVKTASKTGSLDAARTEVVFVNSPYGDYVFSIFTNNNQDQSWTDDNEAEVITRNLSKMLWDYYSQGH